MFFSFSFFLYFLPLFYFCSIKIFASFIPSFFFIIYFLLFFALFIFLFSFLTFVYLYFFSFLVLFLFYFLDFLFSIFFSCIFFFRFFVERNIWFLQKLVAINHNICNRWQAVLVEESYQKTITNIRQVRQKRFIYFILFYLIFFWIPMQSVPLEVFFYFPKFFFVLLLEH